MIIPIEPIGFVRGGRSEAVDDDWGEVTARIDLDATRFGPGSLTGLEEFSHLVIVYHFHLADPGKVEMKARRPRNNPDWPEVGIFAQRGRNRPNHLGVSTCALLGIEGTSVLVQGLDAVDGSPVLDLKPYFREFEPRNVVREPAWVAELMAQYW